MLNLPVVPATTILVDLFFLGYAALMLGLSLPPPPATSTGNRPSLAVAAWGAWPLRVAGKMCFSLYTWQDNVFLLNLHSPRQLFDAPTVAATFLLLFLLSALTFRFIEFPHRPAAELFSLPTASHAAHAPRELAPA